MCNSILLFNSMGPVSHTPGGTLSLPPPLDDSHSTASLKASVLRVTPSPTALKSVITTELCPIAGLEGIFISNGIPSVIPLALCADKLVVEDVTARRHTTVFKISPGMLFRAFIFVEVLLIASYKISFRKAKGAGHIILTCPDYYGFSLPAGVSGLRGLDILVGHLEVEFGRVHARVGFELHADTFADCNVFGDRAIPECR